VLDQEAFQGKITFLVRITGAAKLGIAEGRNEKGNLPAKLLVKFPDQILGSNPGGKY
jgi:hypothetical protein